MIFLLLIGGPIVQDVLVLFQGCTEFMTHAAFYNASNVPLSNVLILRVVKCQPWLLHWSLVVFIRACRPAWLGCEIPEVRIRKGP